MNGVRVALAGVASYVLLFFVFAAIALPFVWDDDRLWEATKFGLVASSFIAVVIGGVFGIVQVWTWAGLK